MLQEDRFMKIIDYLKESRTATFTELAQLVDTSVGTVRKDLVHLERSGMLTVVRGGVVSKNVDLTKHAFNMRSIEHRVEKRELTQGLFGLIVDGQSIAINGGTTNTEVAKFLVENYSYLTILTNNLNILDIFRQKKKFNLIVSGGTFNHEEYTVYGRRCEAGMASYNIDAAILAVNAISLEKGITDFRLEETAIIQTLLKCAKKRIVVADHSKFDRVACMNVCAIEEIDYIVTDSGIGEETIGKYRAAGVCVITPEFNKGIENA